MKYKFSFCGETAGTGNAGMIRITGTAEQVTDGTKKGETCRDPREKAETSIEET